MKSKASVNPVMTGHAVQFMRQPQGFVGSVIAPAFATALQSSDYYVWGSENALNIPQNIRHAPGAKFARSAPEIGEDLYACRDYGHETPVADEVRAKYRNHIAADISAVRRNVDIIKVNHELRVKAKVFSTAVPNADAGEPWDDFTGSDPKGDADAAKEEIRLNCGLRPNVMVISEPVRLLLENHPQLAERLKYTSGGLTTLVQMAAFFGVERIAVAEQIINTAREGQTMTPADIWGNDVLFCHVNGVADLMVPTFMRTFYWSDFGSPGADDVPIQVESYRDETVAGDIHRSRHFTDEKIVNPLCGFRLKAILG